MVLKYVVTDTEWPTLWFGVANVIANVLVSLRYGYKTHRLITYPITARLTQSHSSVVLWVSQNMEDDYTYNLQL